MIKKEYLVIALTVFVSVFAISVALYYNVILAYGDSESHLNIAKRVVDSLTPGAAQLGGVWLPLPHILLIPFVKLNLLWRTGLAGSIVSGISFVIAAFYLYKLVLLLTENKGAAFFSFLIFILNPNILYIQTTPMTEMPLITFFILSIYHFFIFLKDDSDIYPLLLAALFAFCASLSRYDGWFLVIMEAFVLVIHHLLKRKKIQEIEGKFVLFSVMAFFGIFLWLIWDYLILGDPFYFTNSPYSAKSQQMNWLSRGELPAYKNLAHSFTYYLMTTINNFGWLLSLVAPTGIALFLIGKNWLTNSLKFLVLFVPFIFYVITQYMGQSVIFTPELVPQHFEFNLFNVRYGVLMVPILALFMGFIWFRANSFFRGALLTIFFLQIAQFSIYGPQSWIVLRDGTQGLSSSKHPNAEIWLANNYSGGKIIIDDYARTVSIIKSNVDMENVIYVGTKPHWSNTLNNPEKNVDWIVMQKDDAVWKAFFSNKVTEGRLYKYFTKVYTSPNILIFKKSDIKDLSEQVYDGVLTKK